MRNDLSASSLRLQRHGVGRAKRNQSLLAPDLLCSRCEDGGLRLAGPPYALVIESWLLIISTIRSPHERSDMRDGSNPDVAALIRATLAGMAVGGL
jgi:hypothetical protein